MPNWINVSQKPDSNSILNINPSAIGPLIKPIADWVYVKFKKMPKFLQGSLLTVIVIGILYFGYNYMFNTDVKRLEYLTSYVEYLNNVSQEHVKVEDYKKDYIGFYNEFDAVNQYIVVFDTLRSVEMGCIIKYLKAKGGPEEIALVKELEAIRTFRNTNITNYKYNSDINSHKHGSGSAVMNAKKDSTSTKKPELP